jgi:hypothetical protein
MVYLLKSLAELKGRIALEPCDEFRDSLFTGREKP